MTKSSNTSTYCSELSERIIEFLYHPVDKIKWICLQIPNERRIITLFVTEKYDDIRIFDIKDARYVHLWKEEMLANKWIFDQGDGSIVYQIVKDKTPNFDKHTFRYENSLCEKERKVIYYPES